MLAYEWVWKYMRQHNRFVDFFPNLFFVDTGFSAFSSVNEQEWADKTERIDFRRQNLTSKVDLTARLIEQT